METFIWDIGYGSSCKNVKRVNKFEVNNYSDRYQDGINNYHRVWSVKITASSDIATDVLDFLKVSKGVTAFLWSPPTWVS